MVNKDMNGFPVKKCSAFQFFKKRVRRWIKSPMVSVEKHPNASLRYPGSTVMHLPQGDAELEPSLCQTYLSDQPFPRGIIPQEAESCSWESQRSSKLTWINSMEPYICSTSITAEALRLWTTARVNFLSKQNCSIVC
uniref:Uncharacterized protein n=1 Tax=Apteryx owenii TaxID=8824 RepID=A0A8B9PDI3_APTOW